MYCDIITSNGVFQNSMMNLTLTSLSLTNVRNNSPFLSFTSKYSANTQEFSKIITNYAANSIFYFRNNNFHAKIAKSRFNHVINSVIKVDADTLPDLTQYSPFQTLSSELNVDKCSFYNCNSQNKGGSISILSPCVFNCLNSKFYNSTAIENGGCIYAIIRTMNIRKTCLYNCTAFDNGQGFYVESVENDSLSYLNDSTIALCSEYEKKINQNGNHFQKGIINLYRANISDSYTSRGAAALSTHRASVDKILYSNIEKCKSKSIIDFFFSTNSTKIEYTNFIGNSNTVDSNLLIFSSDVDFVSCYFVRNIGHLTGPSAGPTIRIAFTNCLYDKLEFFVSTGIITENCRYVGVHDTPIKAGPLDDMCYFNTLSYSRNNYGFVALIIFVLGFGLTIYLIIAKTSCWSFILSRLPGRVGGHTRSRPITHVRV